MSSIRRVLKFGSLAVLAILVMAVCGYQLLPVPTSPPLKDEQGIVLDAETQAMLTEVVFEAARHDDLMTIDEYLRGQEKKWDEGRRTAEPLPASLRERITRTRDEMHTPRPS